VTLSERRAAMLESGRGRVAPDGGVACSTIRVTHRALSKSEAKIIEKTYDTVLRDT
jgi:hypothetical protein